jgi:hypothetical protein
MITTDLRTALLVYLETKHSNVYYNIAGSKEDMPYIVFNLPFSVPSFNREDYTLEIDVWDNSKDTTVIENLTDSIDGNGDVFDPTGLHRLSIDAVSFIAKIYRSSRQSVEDNDKSIKRRRMIYTVEVYKK